MPYTSSAYTYSSYADPTTELLGPVIALYVILFAVMFFGGLASYIVRSVGLYTIARRMGRAYPGLAFVPFARTYLQGDLAGKIKLAKREIKNPGLWLLLAPIIAGAVFMVVYVIAVIAMVFYFIALEGSGAEPGAGFFSAFLVFMLVILVLAIIMQAVTYVLTGLVNYSIHKRFMSDHAAIMHMLLGILVPLYQSIYFCVIRNRAFVDGSSGPKTVTWQEKSVNPAPPAPAPVAPTPVEAPAEPAPVEEAPSDNTEN